MTAPYDPAVSDALEAQAQADLDEARTDLDAIAADTEATIAAIERGITDTTAARFGMTRRELAERQFATVRTGREVSDEDAADLAVILGCSARRTGSAAA